MRSSPGPSRPTAWCDVAADVGYGAVMKFPRVLRLDQSDTQVFPLAAEPGEPAVPGGFAFLNRDPETLASKDRLAFASGWLGTESFGRATLVEVGEIGAEGYEALVERLAAHFVEHYGAPSLEAARPVAREEADYAAKLCEYGLNTMLALERDVTDEGLTERFKVIHPERAQDHAKIWDIVADEDAGDGFKR